MPTPAASAANFSNFVNSSSNAMLRDFGRPSAAASSHSNGSNSSSSSNGNSTGHLTARSDETVGLVKCPELLLTGAQLERKAALRVLHKKGKRFESPWEPFFVGVYAHTLFYYDKLGELPRGVVPLAGGVVKSVDRIFKNSDVAAHSSSRVRSAPQGEDCGPCWKFTSSAGRVLLFRSPTHESRVDWIELVRQAAAAAENDSWDCAALSKTSSLDSRARHGSRVSVSASPAASSPMGFSSPRDKSPRGKSPRHTPPRRKRTMDVDAEVSETLRDAMMLVQRQKQEIAELRRRLERYEPAGRENKHLEIQDGMGSPIVVSQVPLLTPTLEPLELDELKTGDEEKGNDGEHEEKHEEYIEQHKEKSNEKPEEHKVQLDGKQQEKLDEKHKQLDEKPKEELNEKQKEHEQSNATEEEETVSELQDAQVKLQTEVAQDTVVADSPTQEEHKAVSASLTEEFPVPVGLGDKKDTAKSVASSGSAQTSPTGSEATSPVSTPASASTSAAPVFQPSASAPMSGLDAKGNEALQQQVAQLAEMARSLNKDESTDTTPTHPTSDDSSSPFTSSFRGTPPPKSLEKGNEALQQQANELAAIARNLQSSFRIDKQQAPASSSSSTVPGGESSSSFSDCAKFGVDQINSNDSDESIFSLTQEDTLFLDEPLLDEDGEIERLSEFDASDSHFLEASGILDSIHEVMKDFIVTSQPEQATQQTDQTLRMSDKAVINDDIIAELRQGINSEPRQGLGSLDEAQRLRAMRSRSDDDGTSTSPESAPSPRLRSLFPRAKSARDFLNGDFEVSVRASLPPPPTLAPRTLPELVVEDSMSVVASILQTAGRDEKMLLLNPFLRVFGSRNRLSHLIRWAIEIEVASVINVATLFRSDDYASRLVSTYSKAIGSKFIRVALADPIHQIFKLQIADMELNPHKDENLRDGAQADANAENLMRTCQNIIDSILKNTHSIPSSYFHICSHLNSKVISRFDGSKEGVEAEDASTLTRSVIGGFLFLRFVCPAITTPHLYGLTNKLPPPETRRVLVLVTKLLFKTATGVKFGEREPQFKVLNPFIEKNSPAIQQLFANLAMSPSQDIDECFSSDSRKIYSHVASSQLDEDLTVIRSVAEKNLAEIEKKLLGYSCAPEVTENFKTAVLTPNDPLHKHSLSKKFSANMKFLSGFGKKPRKQSDA